MKTFPFTPTKNVFEESKWLLAVTSFETTNFVSNIPDESNSFSTSTQSFWSPEGGEELIDKPQKLLQLRSENDIELHVKKSWKKSHSNRKRKQWI